MSVAEISEHQQVYIELKTFVNCKKIFFLNQNISCGHSKEPSMSAKGSFEHPKQMLKLMDKKRRVLLGNQNKC